MVFKNIYLFSYFQDTTENNKEEQSLFTRLLQDKSAFKDSVTYLCSLIIVISLVCLLAKRAYALARTHSLRKVLPLGRLFPSMF